MRRPAYVRAFAEDGRTTCGFRGRGCEALRRRGVHKHQIGSVRSCMPRQATSGGCVPAWDTLYESAAAQAGYVTRAQATDAGYSPQLVDY